MPENRAVNQITVTWKHNKFIIPEEVLYEQAVQQIIRQS